MNLNLIVCVLSQTLETTRLLTGHRDESQFGVLQTSPAQPYHRSAQLYVYVERRSSPLAAFIIHPAWVQNEDLNFRPCTWCALFSGDEVVAAIWKKRQMYTLHDAWNPRLKLVQGRPSVSSLQWPRPIVCLRGRRIASVHVWWEYMAYYTGCSFITIRILN